MTLEKVKEFMGLVNKDEELQKKVKEAAKAYTGDKADEKAAFEAVLAPVAKEAGYDFTYEELAELVKNVSEDELSEAELTAAAGGYAFCFVLGVSDRLAVGKCEDGVGWCEHMGFGFGVWDK